MPKCLETVEEFLKSPGVILDVRSPGEFSHARIPGAFDLPLFSDEERSVIGTIYKRQGRDPAVEKGLEFVGPKLSGFVSKAKEMANGSPAKVHCWRGGMRSQSMAWLLETAGLKTVTLAGGYKAFRKWVLEELAQPRKIILLGGMTGSGKTAILRSLKNQGAQILDLESLANHRGSSYGMLGLGVQPSNEQLENEIALHLHATCPTVPLWIEDESRMIGSCRIPDALFAEMRFAKLKVIERPLQERIKQLHDDYGNIPSTELIEATRRLSKRLGGARVKEIVTLIERNDIASAIEITLKYYDSTYAYDLSKRNQPIEMILGEGLSHHDWAIKLLQNAGEP